MARFRLSAPRRVLALSRLLLRRTAAVALIAAALAVPGRAEDQPQPPAPATLTAPASDLVAEQGLYNSPVLVVDPGMHTAIIKRAAVDTQGRWAVTGSDDKTVRVWS